MSVSVELVYSTAAVALALVVLPPAWSRTRHLMTMAHEASHGLAALLTGRRLAGIRLHADSSGATVSRGRATGPAVAVTMAAGYVGPALLGLLGAHLLSRGWVAGILWVTLGLLALLLVQIRNWFGLLVLALIGFATFAVTWWGTLWLQAAVAYTLTWFWLLGSLRPVLELQAARHHRRDRSTDADQLARLTHVPALAWVMLFCLVSAGCLLAGARRLVG